MLICIYRKGVFTLDIGTIIRNRRLELNLTLEEIGNAVGVSKSTVQKWENGFISNMKRDKISALAKVLNINPVTLITGEYPVSLPEGAVPYNPVMHRIPILGDIAAGLPIFSEENYEGYTYTELNHGGKYFAFKVSPTEVLYLFVYNQQLKTVKLPLFVLITILLR